MSTSLPRARTQTEAAGQSNHKVTHGSHGIELQVLSLPVFCMHTYKMVTREIPWSKGIVLSRSWFAMYKILKHRVYFRSGTTSVPCCQHFCSLPPGQHSYVSCSRNLSHKNPQHIVKSFFICYLLCVYTRSSVQHCRCRFAAQGP